MTSLLDDHLSDVTRCGLDSDEIVRKNARTNAHTQIHSIFTLEWHAQRCLGKQGNKGVLKRLWKQFFKTFRNISCIILHFRDPQCCLIALEVHSLLRPQSIRRPTNLLEFGWCDLGRGTSKLESSRKLPANATVSVRFTTKCGAPPGTNRVCR